MRVNHMCKGAYSVLGVVNTYYLLTGNVWSVLGVVFCLVGIAYSNKLIKEESE